MAIGAYKMTELTPEYIRRPLFIVSAPRSGSTLLRAMLRPVYAIPPEGHALPLAIRKWRRSRFLPFNLRKRAVLRAYEKMGSFKAWDIDIRPLYESVTPTKTLPHVLAEIYQLYAKTHAPHAERWGDKTPMLARYLDGVADVFPLAKYIHIVREPHDAIASNIDTFGVPVAQAVERYKRDVAAIRRFGQDNPVFMEVSYEYLVREPYTTILQICHFLNIDFTEDMLTPHKWASEMGDTVLPPHKRLHRPIGTDRIGSWEERLQPEQQEELRRLLDT